MNLQSLHRSLQTIEMKFTFGDSKKFANVHIFEAIKKETDARKKEPMLGRASENARKKEPMQNNFFVYFFFFFNNFVLK